MNLSGRTRTFSIVVAVISLILVIWQVVTTFGVVNVLAAVYLLIGAMIAVETRAMSDQNLEVLLVVPFWLPIVAYGIGKKLYQGRKLVSKEITDEVAE